MLVEEDLTTIRFTILERRRQLYEESKKKNTKRNNDKQKNSKTKGSYIFLERLPPDLLISLFGPYTIPIIRSNPPNSYADVFEMMKPFSSQEFESILDALELHPASQHLLLISEAIRKFGFEEVKSIFNILSDVYGTIPQSLEPSIPILAEVVTDKRISLEALILFIKKHKDVIAAHPSLLSHLSHLKPFEIDDALEVFTSSPYASHMHLLIESLSFGASHVKKALEFAVPPEQFPHVVKTLSSYGEEHTRAALSFLTSENLPLDLLPSVSSFIKAYGTESLYQLSTMVPREEFVSILNAAITFGFKNVWQALQLCEDTRDAIVISRSLFHNGPSSTLLALFFYEKKQRSYWKKRFLSTSGSLPFFSRFSMTFQKPPFLLDSISSIEELATAIRKEGFFPLYSYLSSPSLSSTERVRLIHDASLYGLRPALAARELAEGRLSDHFFEVLMNIMRRDGIENIRNVLSSHPFEYWETIIGCIALYGLRPAQQASSFSVSPDEIHLIISALRFFDEKTIRHLLSLGIRPAFIFNAAQIYRNDLAKGTSFLEDIRKNPTSVFEGTLLPVIIDKKNKEAYDSLRLLLIAVDRFFNTTRANAITASDIESLCNQKGISLSSLSLIEQTIGPKAQYTHDDMRIMWDLLRRAHETLSVLPSFLPFRCTFSINPFTVVGTENSFTLLLYPSQEEFSEIHTRFLSIDPHFPDAIAFVRFYIKGKRIIVANIQSDISRLKLPFRLKEMYHDWPCVALYLLEDYARKNHIEEILITPAFHQMKKWGFLHSETAYRIYGKIPSQLGYTLCRLPTEEVEYFPCNVFWRKRIDPLAPTHRYIIDEDIRSKQRRVFLRLKDKPHRLRKPTCKLP